MKVIRRITKRGCSAHISLPPQMLNFLRWNYGDGVVIEVTSRRTLEIRLPEDIDLRAPMMPMTIDNRVPEPAR